MDDIELRNLEIDLLLETLYRRYGYDFRDYAKASLTRRALAATAAAGYQRVAEMIPRLLHDQDFLAQLLAQFSVPVTEMFRDPLVFKNLRENVLPRLATYPRFNIWQAGCASGEEAYSLAIMLEEEGLLERAQIYATDINDPALRRAEDGIFSMRHLEEYQRNYRAAGGKSELSDYYVASAGYFRIQEKLRRKIVFAHHNLVSDGVFCEVQLILCRNVLIYFNNVLQGHVLHLFHDSLGRGGFLCLGMRESLRSVEAKDLYQVINRESMIFQKSGER